MDSTYYTDSTLRQIMHEKKKKMQRETDGCDTALLACNTKRKIAKGGNFDDTML